MQALGPHLADEAGDRLHQPRVRTPPGDQVGSRPHRRDGPGDALAESEPLGSREPCEQRRHAAQRQPVDRGAAPVDPDQRSLDAGGRTHRAHDLALERVGRFEIARELGARAFAREEHAGVLARAVVGDPSGTDGRPARLGFHRQVRGHPRSRSDNPPARRSRRTNRTWKGSPLWDAHMMATSSSGSGSAIRRRDTAACRGFIDERENTRRSGSPRAASTRPRGSHTTTWPRWTLSTRPERTTRTSGAAVGTREA